MGLLEGIAELLAPTRCAGCELPQTLLCERCRADLPRIQQQHACPRCGAPFGRLVCTECWNTSYAFEAVLSLGELERPLSRAIVLHKDASERRLGAVLGELLAEQAIAEWDGWPEAVAWVPASDAAVARRGFDHARAIAIPVAAALRVPLQPLLMRARARDQRALGRSARLGAAAGSFGVNGTPPARVLVVDDVMTTGATADSAASALLAAGAAAVRAAVLARAW